MSSSDPSADTNDHDQAGSAPAEPRFAYLTARVSGRWTDVYRLAAPGGTSSRQHPDSQAAASAANSGEAVIGRSSANQIVVRTEKASRQHARVFWDDGWTVQDLGSRNGTVLNGQTLAGEGNRSTAPLADGDVIEVAGHAITFSHQISSPGGPQRPTSGSRGSSDGSSPESQATEDQITLELDAPAVQSRRRRSSALRQSEGGDPLLRLAFQLGRLTVASERIDSLLDTVVTQANVATAGCYLREPRGDHKNSAGKSESDAAPPDTRSLNLVATRQSGPRSYRRPPDDLLLGQLQEDASAVLARNILGDEALATENSRGEIDVESLILAPIRDAGDRVWGVLHLTTTAEQPPLNDDDLEFAVTACEVLGESLSALAQTQQLGRKLSRARKQIAALHETLGDRVRLIGRSEAMQAVSEKISLAAPTSATVLVHGESGTGKELVASAIHYASPRRDGPLVCLNCAALSPSLLESELFGHEKGAFTGATERKQGKFEAAHTGTLMLDEIGEMEIDLQAKLLRVLEGHAFERVGGHRPIKADVRVVAATNRDLPKLIEDGKFRQDLYYRLHVVDIHVPPLRERGRDVVLLAEHFLDQFRAEMGRKIEGFTDAARHVLTSHSWPGNVRELRNVVERAVVLNPRPVIDAGDLALTPAANAGENLAPNTNTADVHMSLAELERSHVQRVLRHTENNKSKAAGILGIERSTLDRKLKRWAKQ